MKRMGRCEALHAFLATEPPAKRDARAAPCKTFLTRVCKGDDPPTKVVHHREADGDEMPSALKHCLSAAGCARGTDVGTESYAQYRAGAKHWRSPVRPLRAQGYRPLPVQMPVGVQVIQANTSPVIGGRRGRVRAESLQRTLP